MFRTSFNVYFVFAYAFFVLKLLPFFLSFLGARSGFFWWREVGNLANSQADVKTRVWCGV